MRLVVTTSCGTPRAGCLRHIWGRDFYRNVQRVVFVLLIDDVGRQLFGCMVNVLRRNKLHPKPKVVPNLYDY